MNTSFPWNFLCQPNFLLPMSAFLGSEVLILSALNVEESFNLQFLGRGIHSYIVLNFPKKVHPFIFLYFTLI